jgi:hypothetical protein
LYKIFIYVNAIAKHKARMPDDDQNDQKDQKDKIKKTIECLNTKIYYLNIELKEYEQFLNNNDKQIKDIEIAYKSKLYTYEQQFEMFNFNINQKKAELNETFNNCDNINKFIQKSQHEKLRNIASDISKLADEKIKHISTKDSIDNYYNEQIEKIKGHQNTNTKNMCKTIEQIEKIRKELDIKEKELQDLNQNPNKKRKRMDEDKDEDKDKDKDEDKDEDKDKDKDDDK